MAETGNYQLKQWEKTDRIQMEDFNADNAKTDQALAGLAEQIAMCGNCKLYLSSYVGTGGSGSSSPNSFTFPELPALIFISNESGGFILTRGGVNGAQSSKSLNVTWSGTTMTWYMYEGGYGSTASGQFNSKDFVYPVIALIPAD